MQLRLIGTTAECARLTFLLRFGPPELEVLQVSQPQPTRGPSRQVRVYLQLRLTREPGPAEVTFYSLLDPHGTPVLVDAWGALVDPKQR
jgi:hypothetical protein